MKQYVSASALTNQIESTSNNLSLQSFSIEEFFKQLYEYFPNYLKKVCTSSIILRALDSDYRETHDSRSKILTKFHQTQYLYHSKKDCAAVFPQTPIQKITYKGKTYYQAEYKYWFSFDHLHFSDLRYSYSRNPGPEVNCSFHLQLGDNENIEHYYGSVNFALYLEYTKEKINVMLTDLELTDRDYRQNSFRLCPLQSKEEVLEKLLQVFTYQRFNFDRDSNNATSFYVYNWDLMLMSAKIYNIDLTQLIRQIPQKLPPVDPEELTKLTSSDSYERRKVRETFEHLTEHAPAFAEILAQKIEQTPNLFDVCWHKLAIAYQSKIVRSKKSED